MRDAPPSLGPPSTNTMELFISVIFVHFWGQTEGRKSAGKFSVSEPYLLCTDPDPDPAF
jgi:hypothetical protein